MGISFFEAKVKYEMHLLFSLLDFSSFVSNISL